MQNKADLFELELNELADRAKALSHPARIAILELLADADTCICAEITDSLPLAQATVSQHLKVLREAGLIKARESGQSVFYCLNREALVQTREQLNLLFVRLIDESVEPTCC
jgi:ArsR family transcriptional regulator, arsenate/arsenite/antimonite-responsive transcriptional repressor